MKGLNIKDFKKVSSDGKTTTMKNKHGHEIKLAHKALSPEMRKQLEDLPAMMTDGGDVDDVDSPNTTRGNNQQQIDPDNSIEFKGKRVPAPKVKQPKNTWMPGDGASGGGQWKAGNDSNIAMMAGGGDPSFAQAKGTSPDDASQRYTRLLKTAF